MVILNSMNDILQLFQLKKKLIKAHVVFIFTINYIRITFLPFEHLPELPGLSALF